jgi:hypothetical protein
MKRAVYEAIGGLDEQFGLGLFDDDDLAERARRAGFELAVAHDLFVDHFGSRTFTGAGIDPEKLLSENGRKFAAKWGTPAGNRRAVALQPWTGQERRNARQDQPRMNTDLPRMGVWHAGASGERRGSPSNRVSEFPFRSVFHPCFIRGSKILNVQGHDVAHHDRER